MTVGKQVCLRKVGDFEVHEGVGQIGEEFNRGNHALSSLTALGCSTEHY